MRFNERTQTLVDATLSVVYENGFAEFTMKKVTKKAGVSEALVYKYFPTKEELLLFCFNVINKRMEAIYHDFQVPETEDRTVLYAVMRRMWEMYFDYLVEHPAETIFYYEFLRSPYFPKELDEARLAQEVFLSPYREVVTKAGQPFRMRDAFTVHYLWMYILDNTGFFAQHVIRGELEKNETSRDLIWELLSGGFKSMM